MGQGWMSWKCFYCGNPINPEGRHVETHIEHQYKGGGSRTSWRRFHPPCFAKFETQGGRPWNPETEYTVLSQEEVVPTRES
jgi:hypothetical protein